MKRLTLLSLALFACPPSRVETPDAALATKDAALELDGGGQKTGPFGRIPDALPARLLIGLGDTELGAGWVRAAKERGAKYDARYRYLVMDATGGWATNWCATCARDGRFAARYLEESAAADAVPVLTYYGLLGMPGGGEGESYAKTRNTATMRSYFEDWRLLMTVAKAFGKPVIVHLEPDALANIQQQSKADPQAFAAVAATGLQELADLPDTLFGWGRAFARIRDRVGAKNVILAHHASTWATGVDVMYGDGVRADLALHVERLANFLRGLGAEDLELLFVELSDRDCRFHELVNRQQRCWALSGPVDALTFDRWTAWVAGLNRALSRRVVVWQVPWGGPYQREVREDGTPGSGWSSNQVEFVFGPDGAARRSELAAAGVIGVLFGAGATGQSTHRTSVMADGGLWSIGPVVDFQSQRPSECRCELVVTPAGGGLTLPR